MEASQRQQLGYSLSPCEIQKKKKKKIYGIGYGFSWHTAVINALQWQPPPFSALPHPPALTVLCKPWEIALFQAWATSAYWYQQSKRMPLPHPCQRLSVQTGVWGDGGWTQGSCRERKGAQVAGEAELSLSSDQGHRKPDSAESQLQDYCRGQNATNLQKAAACGRTEAQLWLTHTLASHPWKALEGGLGTTKVG